MVCLRFSSSCRTIKTVTYRKHQATETTEMQRVVDRRVRRECRAAQGEERTTSGIAIRAPRSRTNLQPQKHRKRTSGASVVMSSNLLTMVSKTRLLSSRSLLFAYSKKTRRLTRYQTSGTRRNPTSKSHPKKRTKTYRLCSNSTSQRINPG